MTLKGNDKYVRDFYSAQQQLMQRLRDYRQAGFITEWEMYEGLQNIVDTIDKIQKLYGIEIVQKYGDLQAIFLQEFWTNLLQVPDTFEKEEEDFE